MKSTDTIRYYIKGAFQGVKETAEVLEQQEEIVANLSAKVEDLVSEGKSEAEALGIALDSMGDLGSLAAAFEPATPQPPVVVLVQSARLDFHVTAIAVLLGAILMLLAFAFGAITHLVTPEAGVAVLLTVAAGSFWIIRAWAIFKQNPDDVAPRPLTNAVQVRTSLLAWAFVCGITLLANIVTSGFWFWPFWVAATAWLIRVWIERTLVANDSFTIAECEDALNA